MTNRTITVHKSWQKFPGRVNTKRGPNPTRWRKSCCVKAWERVYLGLKQMNNLKPRKADTPMRASEALSYEPAACWAGGHGIASATSCATRKTNSKPRKRLALRVVKAHMVAV